MLAGIRVLDLTQLLPGPYATRLLTDLGAEVIKVEPPGGDPLRKTPPFLPDGRSARFEALNYGKKSVVLDLKREGDRERFFELARTADVVLEGFRPGVARRLGVDAEAVRAVRPEVIYGSLSGYGQEGPARDHVGHDLNYVARAGLLSLTGLEAPVVPGVPFADLAGGLFLALSVLAALWRRERTGEGCALDAPLAGAAFHGMVLHLAELAATGRAPRPRTMPLCGAYPFYRLYRTRDGRWLSVACLEPKFWTRLCRALGREDLLELQFAEGSERERIGRELEGVFASRPLAAWLEALDPRELPVAPVLDVAEAAGEEGFAELASELPALPFPVRFAGAHPRASAPAPALGEHNAALLETEHHGNA